jgi:hypothetical protein
MHHDRRPLLSTTNALYLLLHIWSVLDVLMEIADVASNILVWFEGERNENHSPVEMSVCRKCTKASKDAELLHRFTTLPLKFPQF